MVGQQIKMVADNQPRLFQPRRLFSKLRQLDQQAVAQIFRCDANRIKTLDSLEDRFHLLQADLVIADAVDNIFNLNREVARIVDGVDDRGGNSAVGVGERRQLNLPHQIVLQRLGGLALIDGKLVVLIVDAVTRRRASGIDFIPAGIERQFVGHLFLLKRIDGIEGLAVLHLFCLYLVVKIGLLKQRVTFQRLLELLLEF
ncbi:Uncharacterised protein [Klebsiella pneumoniae]|nr:Uncharacterised protein [Klebsiella pneumoniae]